MAHTGTKARQAKGALLVMGILVLGAIAVLFISQRQDASLDQGSINIDKDVTIALTGVRHTTIKKGIKEWTMNADSAYYQLERNKAAFSSLQVVFFNKNGNDVHLSADSGIWHTDSNDLEVTGSVMLKNRQYELQTETLTFTHLKNVFATRSSVEVMGDLGEMKADGMIFSLDSERMVLEGNAVGKIGKPFNL